MSRDYQIHLLHANGDQSIHAWFTKEDAEKEVNKIKKQKEKEGNKVTCFEIIRDQS